jgi:hypothetical protein
MSEGQLHKAALSYIVVFCADKICGDNDAKVMFQHNIFFELLSKKHNSKLALL